MSQLEPLLIVTPFFAPQSHAAVFRAYRLAKNLPKFGYRPIVLTVDVNYNYNEDESLVTGLPESIVVETARYIEPTIRGIRMAMGGEDRTFAKMKSLGHFDKPELKMVKGPEQDIKARQSSVSYGSKLYLEFLEVWGHVPDAYWTWKKPALKRAIELIQTYNISLVYTTCVPYTCNEIGLQLQKRGLKWVADFRDPASYEKRTTSKYKHGFNKQREIEKKTYENADALTGLSGAYPKIMYELYGDIRPDKMTFIPTGLDEDILQQARNLSLDLPKTPYLVFSGEYLPEYDGRFFEIFNEALMNETIWDAGWSIYILGHKQMNQARIGPYLKTDRLRDRVRFIDHLPLIDLYAWLMGAHAAVLNPGPKNFWWCNFAKLVDYVALKMPVLAIVPDPSESRQVLTDAGLGVFLDGEGATDQLIHYFLNPQSFKADEEACRKYLSMNMTENFCKIFRRLNS